MLLNLEFGRADIYKKCGVDNHVVRVYPDIFPQLTAASVSGVCVSEQREMEGGEEGDTVRVSAALLSPGTSGHTSGALTERGERCQISWIIVTNTDNTLTDKYSTAISNYLLNL